MPAGSTAPDILVVGGGAIGLASAWRLVAGGASVTVVDPEPGRGASWAAAGMLAPVTEAQYGEEELLRLNLASVARWPGFAAELEEASGGSSGYRETGTVVAARDRDDLEELERLADYQRELGLDVERLRSREIRRLEPGLAPTVRGGLLVTGDHQVDNRALVEALGAACQRRAVGLVHGRVAEVTSSGDRATGVRLATGEVLAAGTVVIAAGAWSSLIGGLPEPIPVRPVKGQLLHLRGPANAPLATRTVRGLDVYLVPRDDGRLVIGATVEEMGYGTAVTAGAVLDLLRDAYELVPGVTELELAEATAGVRPGTPDNAPLIGPGALDRLIVATGHFRNGILLTPVTADAVATLATRGEVPTDVAPFDPGRFRTRTEVPAWS